MAKNDTFEEKILKKLKAIENLLECVNEHTSDTVDYVNMNSSSDYTDNIKWIADSMNDIANALADETYLNGSRFGSAFDTIKTEQANMSKTLTDMLDDIRALYSEMEDCNRIIYKLKDSLHDTIVTAIRDAMNPDYVLDEK